MDALLNTNILGNELVRWILALGVAALALIVFSVLRRWIRQRVKTLAERTATVWDDALSEALASVHGLTLTVIALWIGSRFLTLEPTLDSRLNTGLTIIVIGQIALAVNHALQRVGRFYRDLSDLDGGRRTTLSAFTFLGRLVLFSLAILLILENLGVDITALLAGIGIGAVAIGLALQNILSDLFASLSIILDKPFEIGDFVVVDDLSGTIENIGLRTTRVRSLSGEQLVFANNDLLTSRIRNYKRMKERRVVFTLGVTYDTPSSSLKEIPEVLKEIIEMESLVRFDRAHFKAFSASSLDFEVVYWMLDPDYATFMDTQQRVNLAIVDAFSQRNIEFAFPTQTVFVQHAAPAS